MKKTMIGKVKVSIIQNINKCSLWLALAENRYRGLIKNLRRIEPDISRQHSHQTVFNNYWEFKMRSIHAFQCSLMLKALEYLAAGRNLTVIDIGDSAGTHMSYLKVLIKDKFDIDTISVDLDPIAIEKIKARGQKAVLCRAEELDLGDKQVDLFTSFEMVEHLHDPMLFFRRLAKKSQCNKLVVTVPYMKRSRVGLHNIRNNLDKTVFAGGEHIFELSPKDWTLLMLHSGWKVIYSKIYYQYPRWLPILSQLLGWYWRRTDFEGFWGVILEKDCTFSDRYQGWQV